MSLLILKIVIIMLTLQTSRPKQTEFIADFHSNFIDFIGGNRCGKTYGGAEKGILLTILNGKDRKVYGLAIEPTLSMASEILKPKLELIAEKYNIRMIWREQKHKFIFPDFSNSEILLRSAEKPQRIEGGEYCWIWLDEPAQCKPEIWKRVITRLNDKHAIVKQIFTTGTPEGLNWYHKEITREDKKGKSIHKVVYGSIDEIILNAGYDHIRRLQENLDPLVLQEKLYGKFINTTTGKVYYAFDEKFVINNFTPMLNLPVRISCDFNINPCVWNLHQFIEDKIYTFDEIVMYNANTPLMCEKLNEVLNKYGLFAGYYFYGDYTSIKQRTTATSYTDWNIIENFYKNYPNFKTKLRSNPKVKARVEIQNGLFSHNKHFIKNNCKYLIDDYRYVVWNENGYELEKNKDKDRTHASDGTGYMLTYEFSLDKKYSQII